jgi:hypothetical protein
MSSSSCVSGSSLGLRVVGRGEHQRRHPVGHVGRAAGSQHAVARPLRAALLVVAAARVVDGVVEPQRQFHFGRPPREHRRRVEVGQALAQVLQRVVAAMRLAVGGQQLVEQAAVGVDGSGAQLAPQAPPGLQAQIAHDPPPRWYASRTSRPSSMTAMA